MSVSCSTNASCFSFTRVCSKLRTNPKGLVGVVPPTGAIDARSDYCVSYGRPGSAARRTCGFPGSTGWREAPRILLGKQCGWPNTATDNWACLSSTSQRRAFPPREGLRLKRGGREVAPTRRARSCCAQVLRRSLLPGAEVAFGRCQGHRSQGRGEDSKTRSFMNLSLQSTNQSQTSACHTLHILIHSLATLF